MPGHAAASGSALGGFIEGVTGGFERTTEFRRRRRLEQQVAEQLRARTERQGRQDVRQVALDEQAEAARARARAIQDFELSQEHGVRFDPTEVQGRVDQLRQGVGEAITTGAALPPGFTKIGLSAAERETEERGGFLGKVAEFMALSPEEREAAMQDPETQRALDELGIFDDVATAPPAGSSARYGVTGGGFRTLTGGTREQADAFSLEFPAEPEDLRTDPRMRQLFTRFTQIKGQMLKPVPVDLNLPSEEMQAGLERGDLIETAQGVFRKPPDMAVVNQRAIRQAREEFGPMFDADDREELDRILEELASGSENESEPKDEIAEARLLVQGLPREEQENELAAVGYTADEIKRILDGR